MRTRYSHDIQKTSVDNSKRVEWIDVCRGAALLVVLLGHCISNAEYLGINVRGLIFSFHMPLFFMLSGYTFRYSSDRKMALQKLKRGFQNLFLLAIVCYIIRTSVIAITGGGIR